MNESKIAHAVIIDPFSSGRFLVEEFRRRGIPSIAVLTDGIPQPFAAAFKPTEYASVIEYKGNPAALVAALNEYNPLCVAIGIETGIALMDRLNAMLGFPGNAPDSSELRRDKFSMQEAVRGAGLAAVAQCRTDNVDTAAQWLDLHATYPVVVKPAQSAGSDNIHICGSKREALEAVASVLEARNLFGARNEHALVQEFLDGQEWVVDTVSCAGRCKAVNVTSYRKVRTADDQPVYRHSAFLPPDEGTYGELIDYAKLVAAALGIEWGAAHIEIIVTSRGPVLVEVNSRMHGGDAVMMLRDYARFTQLELVVDALIDPAAFLGKVDQDVSYSAYLVAHFLISQTAGTVTRVIEQPVLRELDSFVAERLPRIGDIVRVTNSLTSSPGYLWLANASRTTLEQDQARLEDWESCGVLYSA